MVHITRTEIMSRFIFVLISLMLVTSVALNVYQLHMFATADLSKIGDPDDLTSMSPEDALSTDFILNIDVINDGLRTSRSYPFWVKEKLGNVLNVNINQFESLIQTYCYVIDVDGADLRNCIDSFKVWIQPSAEREEAFIAIIGEPVDTARRSSSAVCSQQACRSFRLLHFAAEKDAVFVVSDSGYRTIAANEKNMDLNLIKISQGGLSAWTKKVDWFDGEISTTDLSIYLSTGKNIVESLKIPIKGSWIDADCMEVAEDEPIKFQQECTRHFSSNFTTNFQQSPFWSPSDLNLSNSLNIKGAPLKIMFDRETNQYLIPEKVTPDIKDLLRQLHY